MSAVVPRVHQELADLCAAILPGLQGLDPRAHTLSSDLWAALVTWTSTGPATGLGLRAAGAGRRRRSFLDLMEDVPTSGSLFVPSIDTAAAPAGLHAIGAVKATTDLVFGGRDEPLVNVATVMTVTDEVLDDVPQLEAWIGRWLRWNVSLGEEKEVLTGPGGAGRLKGFYARTPEIVDVAASSVLEGISQAFADIAGLNGLLPDGVVLNPAAAGPFLADNMGLIEWVDGQPTIFGMAICLSPYATKPLVGAFGAGAVLGRNGTATVQGTQSHDLNFTKNISAIRVETRLALGVMAPALFRTITVA